MGLLDGLTVLGVLKRILIYEKSQAESQARQALAMENLVKIARLSVGIDADDLRDIDQQVEGKVLMQTDEDMAKIEDDTDYGEKHGRHLKADEFPIDPLDWTP